MSDTKLEPLDDLVIVSKSKINDFLYELEEKYDKKWLKDLSPHSEGMVDGVAITRVALNTLLDKATDFEDKKGEDYSCVISSVYSSAKKHLRLRARLYEAKKGK